MFTIALNPGPDDLTIGGVTVPRGSTANLGDKTAGQIATILADNPIAMLSADHHADYAQASVGGVLFEARIPERDLAVEYTNAIPALHSQTVKDADGQLILQIGLPCTRGEAVALTLSGQGRAYLSASCSSPSTPLSVTAPTPLSGVAPGGRAYRAILRRMLASQESLALADQLPLVAGIAVWNPSPYDVLDVPAESMATVGGTSGTDCAAYLAAGCTIADIGSVAVSNIDSDNPTLQFVGTPGLVAADLSDVQIDGASPDPSRWSGYGDWDSRLPRNPAFPLRLQYPTDSVHHQSVGTVGNLDPFLASNPEWGVRARAVGDPDTIFWSNASYTFTGGSVGGLAITPTTLANLSRIVRHRNLT